MLTKKKLTQKIKKQLKVFKKYPSLLIGSLSFITLLIVCLFVTTEDMMQAPITKVISGKAIAAMNPLLTVTPIPVTPTPTLTPTPTTEPTPVYTGYCLNVPVLMYHHIEPGAIAKEKNHLSLNVDPSFFDQQMAYINARGFTTIFAEDLVNALAAHTSLPSKSIVVTIDDGYDDNYSYAFPIIKKYNIKTSLMVPTGLMGVNAGTNTYYTWGQLQEMIGSGLIRPYNHTWSHAAMGQGEAKDISEITTAQNQLQQYTGHTVGVFAYPYGTNALSEQVHAELRSHGFIGAFSTIYGTYQCDSFIFSLHRVRVGNSFFPAYGIN